MLQKRKRLLQVSNGERGPGWGKGYIGDYYPGRDFDYIEEENERIKHQQQSQ